MATFSIKQHDTAPAITSTLTDSTGAAVNITGATVRFHMYGSPVLNAAATIVNAATGAVSYAWQAADTAKVGAWPAEWEVTFAGGAVETFPNSDNIIVLVTPDVA